MISLKTFPVIIVTFPIKNLLQLLVHHNGIMAGQLEGWAAGRLGSWKAGRLEG
jgi:hypothetical protein